MFHVALIVLGALQIFVDDDDDDGLFLRPCSDFIAMLLRFINCRFIIIIYYYYYYECMYAYALLTGVSGRSLMRWLNSRPSRTRKSSPGFRIPHFMAILRAVLTLSPVTIRTVMPDLWHLRIASGTYSQYCTLRRQIYIVFDNLFRFQFLPPIYIISLMCIFLNHILSLELQWQIIFLSIQLILFNLKFGNRCDIIYSFKTFVRISINNTQIVHSRSTE